MKNWSIPFLQREMKRNFFKKKTYLPARWIYASAQRARAPARDVHAPARGVGALAWGLRATARNVCAPARGVHAPARVACAYARSVRAPARDVGAPARGACADARGVHAPARSLYPMKTVILSTKLHKDRQTQKNLPGRTGVKQLNKNKKLTYKEKKNANR